MTNGYIPILVVGAGGSEHARTSVKLLIASVEKPKNPFIVNPAMIHLISEIPEPAAYFAKRLTR